MIVEVSLAALTLGFGSSLHCAFMCGPLVGARCERRTSMLWYLVGRSASYALVGAIAGRAGLVVASWAGPFGPRLMMVALGATLLVIGMRALVQRTTPDEVLVTVRAGPPRRSWMARLLDAMVTHLPRTGLALGLVTGIFPCGVLAIAIAAAATTASPAYGALTMSMFALGSIPLLMLGAVTSGRLVQALGRGGVRMQRLVGTLFLVLGTAMIVTPLLSIGRPRSASPCCHTP